MESPILNQLAEKYWQGACTDQEEQQLKEALTHVPVPEGLEALADYLSLAKAEQSVRLLDEQFDAEMLERIQQKHAPIRRLMIPQWFTIAASILLLIGLGMGLMKLQQPMPEKEVASIESEFVDTYEDPAIAYEEVKKAMMMISSNMNEGLTHAQRLGEFHKATAGVQGKEMVN